MPEIIHLVFSARIKNGPTMAFSNSLEVDAYDKLDVSVSAGGGATIQLIPAAIGAVKFLLIQSSHYSQDLTYQVNGGGNDIVLDSPQSFIGEGAVSTLDSAAQPSTLVFTNGLGDDVQIQILVGRSATA